jgi:hypothetical protein
MDIKKTKEKITTIMAGDGHFALQNVLLATP